MFYFHWEIECNESHVKSCEAPSKKRVTRCDLFPIENEETVILPLYTEQIYLSTANGA